MQSQHQLRERRNIGKSIDPIDADVGRRVRLQRRCLKLTQRQLGELIGISFQQISQYEIGSDRISASRLKQIARTLGVTPSFFFEPDMADVSERAEKAAILLAMAEAEELIKGFLRIQDPRMRRIVIGMIEQLASAQTGAG